mgnify:CR=1 FL=1
MFIGLTIVVWVISDNNRSLLTTEGKLTDIDNIFFQDSLVLWDYSLVLFYVDSSDVCRKMEENLIRLKNETGYTHIHKINADLYPDLVHKYNISGVPNILLLKKGVDHGRIMGVVSFSNIKMIYNRHRVDM